ncbi:MAG: MBL fold metallo-hydrolase [Thermoanaerobaculia bacterium]
MRIEKWIHSCLLVEDRGGRVLIDPGKFSFRDGAVDPARFRDLAAIVITHEHVDHMDEDALKTIRANNPKASLIANASIASKLSDVTVLESGRRSFGAIEIEAISAAHADLLNATPPKNVGYVLNGRLLHPGDSFHEALEAKKGIEILALPVMAPWNTELMVAAFATRIAPKVVIPIHDGYGKDFFVKMRHDNYKNYFEKQGIEFVPLAEPGSSMQR